LDVDAEIIPNTKPLDELDCDGLVLSGGAPSVNTEALKLGLTGDYLDGFNKPILGICVGCQFIALYLGGKTRPADVPEFGKTEVTVTEQDDILAGVPEKFTAWESHNDEIAELPDSLIKLAYSQNCLVQAFKHVEKPYYGVQFHPEVEHTEYGYDIFKNFINICESHQSE
jgi:GMP synthase (glutamine-hydrolysing)